MSWPAWHLDGEPIALVKYVLPDEVGRYLTLPGPTAGPALPRLAAVYRALTEAGVTYSHGPLSRHPDWQRVQPPAAVLRRPGHGTCLDLAVTMAGACLVAGLHPLIVVVEAEEPHALLLVRLEESPLDDGRGWWRGPVPDVDALVTTDVDGPPRPLVAVDPVGFARAPLGGADPRFACDFPTAVARGAEMLLTRPGLFGVDVGRVWLASEVHDPQSAPDEDGPGERAWTYHGGQGRRHFDNRAHGRQTPAWRREMFVGRKAAVDRVLEHCQGPDDSGAPLIITGPPGSGKSSVLGRAVIKLEELGQRGVAVHGRDAPFGTVVAAVAEACGLRATTEPELVEQLDRAPVSGIVVAVDALDEMRTKRDRSDVAHLLCELAALDGVRVVVATRSGASERPDEQTWKRSDLVRELYAGAPDEKSVVDLDSDDYFSSGDLTDLIELILRTGGSTAGNRPGAHRAYAADPQLLAAVAGAVQVRAGRNYLMAALIAAFLARQDQPIDPRTPGFDESILPATIGDTLRRVVDTLPPDEASRAQALLKALAYGRGSGLTDSRWVEFAHALGHRSMTEEHIQQLRASAAADYLFENIRKDGRSHTRLFHRALADHLRSQENRTWDESRLCDLLRPGDAGDPGWADGYVRRFLPSHVLAAGRCEEFLDLPEFLVHCYPSAVGPVAYAVPISRGTEPAAVFRLALPYLKDGARGNAETLEMAARTQGTVELGERIAALAEHPLAEVLCVEALPSEVPDNVLLQHVGVVNEVCVLGPDRVVTVSDDGTARVWDPYDRESPQQAIFARHEGPVWAATTLTWPGIDGPVVVTVSEDGTVRIWDPHDQDVPQLATFAGHTAAVRGVATLPWPGVTDPVVVTTSDDGTARVWDPHRPGCPELARFTGHTEQVLAVTTLPRSGHDLPLLVTTSEDATCRVWDPYAPGCPEVACFAGHTSGDEFWTRGLTTAAWPGLDDPVVVSAGGDSTARVWRPIGAATEELLSYGGHRTRIRNVFTLPWDDAGAALATCGDDGAVRLWRPDGHGGVRTLGTYDAHPGNVSAGVFLHPPGRPPVIVSCSEGGVHVWNPYELMSSTPSVRGGHDSQVRSAVLLDDTRLVTSANDATARIWETRDGQAVELGAFTRHSDWVRHLAVLPWFGPQTVVVATASGDGTVRVWDPLDPDGAELVRFDKHGDPVRTVQPVRVPGISVTLMLSAGADNAVRLWNPYGRPEEYAVLRHPETVRCAILVSAPDGDAAVVAATGDEVHVWRLGPGLEVPDAPARVFRGHHAWVRDLEAVDTAVGLRICSVGNDHTLRIWDPFGVDDEHDRGVGHSAWIWGVTSAPRPGGPLVMTTSNDGSVRFWRHTPGEGTGVSEVDSLQLLTAGWSIRCQDDRFVVTTGRGFVLYRLAAPADPVNAAVPRARSAPLGETRPDSPTAAIPADPSGRERPAAQRADRG